MRKKVITKEKTEVGAVTTHLTKNIDIIIRIHLRHNTSHISNKDLVGRVGLDCWEMHLLQVRVVPLLNTVAILLLVGLTHGEVMVPRVLVPEEEGTIQHGSRDIPVSHPQGQGVTGSREGDQG